MRARVTGTATATTMPSRRPREEGHEDHDREGGDQHVLDELVRFFIGGEAVVAGLGDLDVRGQEPPLERRDELVELLDQRDSVGARLLGHRQGHRRGVDCGAVYALFVRRRPRAHPHVGARIFGPVEDLCHILEVDGRAL